MKVKLIESPCPKTWENYLKNVLAIGSVYTVVREFSNAFVIQGSNGEEYMLTKQRFESVE